MNPIFATIVQELEGPLVAQVAQRLGIDQATAARAVTVAIPVLLSLWAHRGASGSSASIPEILGPNSNAVTQGIGQSAGLSPAQTQQLLSVVAPAVMGKLQNQNATAAVVPDHAKEIGPALAAGDHESIVSAITRFGQKVLSSTPPAGRLF